MIAGSSCRERRGRRVLVSDYVFGSSDLVTEQRDRMQTCLDPVTTGRLEALGVGPGWRCWDVGGGGGSVARWLAERVGETGHVVVTDIDTGGLEAVAREHAAVSVHRHDVVADDAPATDLDLVHARLVLLHLPERLRALERMVRALRPGGRLLLGEFDCTWMPVLAAPDDEAARLVDRFQRALLTVLSGAGADPRWGVHAYRALRDVGLTDLETHVHAEPWPGGSPGCRWLDVNARQLEQPLLATGLITPTELDVVRASFSDPTFVISSYLTIHTWGRRRAG